MLGKLYDKLMNLNNDTLEIIAFTMIILIIAVIYIGVLVMVFYAR